MLERIRKLAVADAIIIPYYRNIDIAGSNKYSFNMSYMANFPNV